MRALGSFPAGLAAALSVTSLAGAQSITVPDTFQWSIDHGQRPTSQINRGDCLADASITFSTRVVGASGGAFEVWTGSDCTNVESRRMHASCNPVALPDIDATEVTVRIQDLLQDFNESAGPDTGTAEACEATSNTYGGIERNLFFFVRDTGNDTVAGTATTKKFLYDITAPAPPTNIKAGPGEESLELTFDPAGTNDIKGYRFFCSAVGSAPAGTGGAAAASGSSGCSSSVLVPGQPPPPDTDCGDEEGKGIKSGTATGLQNGVTSAVAVAGVDEYDNVGVLSSLACGTPQEVTGYFEAYRAAGGKAGGGFCSFGPARQGSPSIGLALLLGAATLLRRRK